MNANEVIATLAGEGAHPNDHVNMGQSSNDVFPSAVHLAALDEATNRLLPALERLERVARRQGRGVRRHRQGRPHAPDGRRPGHARPGVRRLRRADPARAARRVANALPQVAQIPLGGTATGTGLNTHPEFAAKVRERLAAETGLDVRAPEDPFEAQGNRDALVELSGALKVIAVSLTKIANDLALMGSGPRAGIGELFLPELQKGSSIMPGKVNPVIPEVVLQVSAQVIGNDTAITVGGLQGQFELNVRIPLIARNLLQSIALLAVDERAVRGEVRRRDRGEPRRLRGVGRGHARGRDRAQPVHRLRQGGRDRQGRVGERPHAARGRARARRRRGDARRRARPAQDRGGLGGRRMSAVGTDADLLERIEAYFDAAPRPAADVEEHGALTLFVSRIPWRFYGRPRLGLAEDVGADDVAAVRARQRELGVREAFEWVHETTPSLAGAATRGRAARSLQVPLLALDRGGVGAAARARRRDGADARRRRPRAARPRRRRSSSRSPRTGMDARRRRAGGARPRDRAARRPRLPARAAAPRADRDGGRRERGGRRARRRLAPARRRRRPR